MTFVIVVIMRSFFAPQASSPIVGKHVRTLATRLPNSSSYPACAGIAVSPDGDVMAISGSNMHKIALYDLPDGVFRTELGSYGSGPGQFNEPSKICFSPMTCNLLIADRNNRRVQVGAFMSFSFRIVL